MEIDLWMSYGTPGARIRRERTARGIPDDLHDGLSPAQGGHAGCLTASLRTAPTKTGPQPYDPPMAPSTLAFLGGNGHCAARLSAARAYLPARIDLVAVPYPGFEGRPRAADLEGFLTAVADHLVSTGPDLVYATGIGGLLALCLRARGALAGIPILMQGPVLWGLEKRMMPRIMRKTTRLAPMQWALSRMFATAVFQRRFVRKYFTRRPDDEILTAFFAGYAECTALPDFFAWLTPDLLRSLETELARRPAALAGIRIWWGGRDAVVSPRELEWTVSALGSVSESVARWPVRVFPDWGHYPMIDAPAEWAQELAVALASTEAV